MAANLPSSPIVRALPREKRSSVWDLPTQRMGKPACQAEKARVARERGASYAECHGGAG